MTSKREYEASLRRAKRVAKKHGIPPATQPTPREKECLEAVHANVEAREALAFLAAKTQCNEHWLITQFVVCAWMGRADADLLALPAGVSTPEELLKHEKSIREVAEVIGKLNVEKHWHADCPDITVFLEFGAKGDVWEEPGTEKGQTILHPNPRSWNDANKAFKTLPRILKMYARSLRGKAWSELGRQRIQRRNGNRQHQMESTLLDWMNRVTGHMYREKVAAILGVINPKAGLWPTKAETLRKRDRRRRGLA